MSRLLCLVVLSLAATACNTEPAPEVTDEESVQIDDDSIEDEEGKTDAATKAAVIKGTLTNGSVKTGTLPASTYWGWKVTATAGQTLRLDVDATTATTRYPVALIYGPKSGTSWGSRLARTVGSGSNTQAKTTIATSGTYLVLIAESARRSYGFRITLDLSANACAAATGTCRALTQQGCPSNEHVGDAGTYSCGGPVGVMCCLPGFANDCTDAGGACMGLNPAYCRGDHHFGGNARACGPGLGVACCMPLCKPYCGAIGSRSEGWYDGCGGALIGWATCAGKTASCLKAGTSSEGWYAGSTSTAKLIKTADCD